MARDDARISPTAHYTGYVWVRAGLSEPALATAGGALLYQLMRPVGVVSSILRTASIEAMLLARHTAIDDLLTRAIEAGDVGQVLEVAAGLSPRGRDFAERYADRGLVYVEGDLPGMAQRKSSILQDAPTRRGQHHVVALDAFDPTDLDRVCDQYFDPTRGTAILTEGLVMYFDAAHVTQLWNRFHAALSRFPHGLYLSDMHTAAGLRTVRGSGLFRWLVGTFARGRVHIDFEHTDDVREALLAAGFSAATVRDARALAPSLHLRLPPGVVHIIEAKR